MPEKEQRPRRSDDAFIYWYDEPPPPYCVKCGQKAARKHKKITFYCKSNLRNPILPLAPVSEVWTQDEPWTTDCSVAVPFCTKHLWLHNFYDNLQFTGLLCFVTALFLIFNSYDGFFGVFCAFVLMVTGVILVKSDYRVLRAVYVGDEFAIFQGISSRFLDRLGAAEQTKT